jgi:predicted flap endonuclease-1-like 5' DNA nuclease
MYLISQTLIYLALALLIGGGIGYAFRACLADTACDDVREDLALARARLSAMEHDRNSVKLAPVQGLTPFPAANDSFVAKPETAARLSDLDARGIETVLLAAAPGTSPKIRFEFDDLTTIKGLTPKMDAWLSGLGITRLADIASLTPSELYWLVENLPENGASVYRDHWVAQATRLTQRN